MKSSWYRIFVLRRLYNTFLLLISQGLFLIIFCFCSKLENKHCIFYVVPLAPPKVWLWVSTSAPISYKRKYFWWRLVRHLGRREGWSDNGLWYQEKKANESKAPRGSQKMEAIRDSARVCARFFANMLWLFFLGFCRTLNSGCVVSLPRLPALKSLFSCWAALSSLEMRVYS